MRYTERKEFPVAPDLFRKYDVITALRVHAEYVRKGAAFPTPAFFEVDRGNTQIDPLWHTQVGDYDKYSRRLEIPCLNQFQRPDWRLTKIGLMPQRRDVFWLSHLSLMDEATYGILAESAHAGIMLPYAGFDYFPTRGDRIFWNGYRYMIINVVMPPDAFWQQTNVWLGLTVECTIPPDGDALPLKDLSQLYPVETGNTPGSQAPTIGAER